MQDSALPEWLTQEYMQSKLRVYHKDQQLKVLKLWSKAATSKGQNYVGIITRIHVDYKQSNGTVQRRTYLLKDTCAQDTPQAEIFEEYGVYTREMDMYEFILPRMADLLLEAGIKEKLHADAIHIDRGHSVIILEDLAPLHYKNADRVKQLDVPHVKVTLDMLAKFHASALILKQRQPELLAKNFNTSFFSRQVKGYGKIVKILFKALIRYVKTQPKLAARYHDKLELVLENILEYGARTLDVNESDFETLLHGDCWTTNIMFLYDSNDNPTAVLPIDFQFSVCTSPAVDLLYFFGTSLQEDVLAKETELVQHYYYALRSVLKQLKYAGKVPSLLEFQLQMERRRFMCVFFSLIFQVIMTYNGTGEPDWWKLTTEVPEALSFQDSLYLSEKAQGIVDRMLPIFDAKGLLDEQ